MTLPVLVREFGGVSGDSHRREALVGASLDRTIKPNYSPHLLRFPPQLYVVLPLLPELGGGGNAEGYVFKLCSVEGIVDLHHRLIVNQRPR